MMKWLQFLSTPETQAVLMDVLKQPRKTESMGPYQMPILSHDPGKVMAVVVGKVSGPYTSRFVALDPTGTAPWQRLSKGILKVISQESPRCVFIVCGPDAEIVMPDVCGEHVVVRLARREIGADEAEHIIQAAAEL